MFSFSCFSDKTMQHFNNFQNANMPFNKHHIFVHYIDKVYLSHMLCTPSFCVKKPRFFCFMTMFLYIIETCGSMWNESNEYINFSKTFLKH
jgi:hypothetical protein